MKHVMELDELSGGVVSHLSLVTAGAAMTPWKIQKADNANEGGKMLDFKKVFVDAPIDTRVLAVAVSKGADTKDAEARITAAGLSTEVRKDMDGTTVYLQGEDALEDVRGDVVSVKVTKDVAAVVNVRKGFAPWTGSSDFSTNLQSLGFLPSFDLSVDALRTSVFNALDADSQEAAAKDVKKVASDFAGHVAALVGELPQEVFKLEQFVGEHEQFSGTKTKKPEDRDGTDGGSNPDADLTAGEAEAKAQGGQFTVNKREDETETQFEIRKAEIKDLEAQLVVKGGSVAPTGIATGDGNPADPDHSPGAAATGQATDQEDNGLVGPTGKETIDSATSSIPGVTPQPTGVSKEELEAALSLQMDAINALFAGVAGRLDTVETDTAVAVAKAEASAEAVGATVLGDAADDSDLGGREEVRNSIPLLDTAVRGWDA